MPQRFRKIPEDSKRFCQPQAFSWDTIIMGWIIGFILETSMCGTNSSQRSLPDSWRKKTRMLKRHCQPPMPTNFDLGWPWITVTVTGEGTCRIMQSSCQHSLSASTHASHGNMYEYSTNCQFWGKGLLQIMTCMPPQFLDIMLRVTCRPTPSYPTCMTDQRTGQKKKTVCCSKWTCSL